MIIERNCMTCKHEQKSVCSEPCLGCRVLDGEYTNWEKKGNKNMTTKSNSHRCLKITLEDSNYKPIRSLLARGCNPQLYNIPNIVKEVHDGKTEIEDEDEIKEIFMSLCEYFQRKNITSLVFAIDKVESELAPAKEMTIGEIEKQLGHKVKIVGDKK